VRAAFIGQVPLLMLMAEYNGIPSMALLLSIAATVSTRNGGEMGIVTKKEHGNIIKEEIVTPWMKILIFGLILSAIVIGKCRL